MLSHKRPKQAAAGKIYQAKNVSSPKFNKKHKPAHQTDRNNGSKIIKKRSAQGALSFTQAFHKHSLFHSLQNLPISKLSKHTSNKKERRNLAIQSIHQDSTASRDLRQITKHYDRPNGDYFGSRVNSLDNKNTPSRIKKTKKHSKREKSTRSLQRHIREYRRLSSQHESQSKSLRSQLSDQQLRRLQKMQSIEKIKVMEGIIDIEQRRLQLMKMKSDFRL